jgi:hypothetical protein
LNEIQNAYLRFARLRQAWPDNMREREILRHVVPQPDGRSSNLDRILAAGSALQ